MSKVEEYLLKEYENAGELPRYTYFHGLDVLIPYSYVAADSKNYEDNFNDDFFDLKDNAISQIVDEYSTRGFDEPDVVSIENVSVPVPYFFNEMELSNREKRLFLLENAFELYTKAITLTAVTNKLTQNNTPVKIGKENIDRLWDLYEKVGPKFDYKEIELKRKIAELKKEAPAPSSEKLEFLKTKAFGAVANIENIRRQAQNKLKNLEPHKAGAAAVTVGVLAAAAMNSGNNTSLAPDESFYAHEISFIQTGSTDYLTVEDYDAEKDYQITTVKESKKEEVKKAPKPEPKPETKKEEKKETAKPAQQKPVEEKKTEPQKIAIEKIAPITPSPLSVNAPSLDLTIKIKPLTAQQKYDIIFDEVIEYEGEYGNTAKEIRSAKEKIAKLKKDKKTIPADLQKISQAKVIDQETNWGITNKIYQDGKSKYKKQLGHLPKKLINLKKEDAKDFYFHVFYKPNRIDKVEALEMASLLFDIKVNHSTKTSNNLIKSGADFIADKKDLDKPESHSGRITLFNELSKDEAVETMNKILDDRIEFVKGSTFEKGLTNRYTKQKNKINEGSDTQLASGQSKGQDRG